MLNTIDAVRTIHLKLQLHFYWPSLPSLVSDILDVVGVFFRSLSDVILVCYSMHVIRVLSAD